MSSPRAAIASLGLVVLLGDLGLPLVGLGLADEPAPFCCSKGRCCCADADAGPDERPCLRRGCGCGHDDTVVAGAQPWFEAVLPVTSGLQRPGPCSLQGSAAPGSLLARPHAPPVPPPRRCLSA